MCFFGQFKYDGTPLAKKYDYHKRSKLVEEKASKSGRFHRSCKRVAVVESGMVKLADS